MKKKGVKAFRRTTGKAKAPKKKGAISRGTGKVSRPKKEKSMGGDPEAHVLYTAGGDHQIGYREKMQAKLQNAHAT